MAGIKSTRQFKERVDSAFETQRTRDEAKACYDFAREEFETAAEELCAYAAANPDVFEGHGGKRSWGSTDTVAYTVSSGTTVERIDGGSLNDAEWLNGLPKRFIRKRPELNKAKINADKLDAEKLAALGLVRVATASIKLKAKSA